MAKRKRSRCLKKKGYCISKARGTSSKDSKGRQLYNVYKGGKTINSHVRYSYAKWIIGGKSGKRPRTAKKK
jgi:hypothetical protein